MTRSFSVVRETAAAAALSLVLVSGCQCSSGTAAQHRTLDDAGPREPEPGDDSGVGAPRLDGASGEAGVPAKPVDGVAEGGRIVDANADAASLAPDGAADAAIDAPAPISLVCGDGIRGLDEECDDGNIDEQDFCSATCRVIDRLALWSDNEPAKRRILGGGHHVVAGTRQSSVVLFADSTASPAWLGAVLFSPNGSLVVDQGIPFSEDRTPYEPTEVAVAALPKNHYALAWTTLRVDGDGLGIALRDLDGATGALGGVSAANSETFGAQQSVDAVWTGAELVVAWVDRGGPSGSRVRARRFDRFLSPLGTDEPVAPDTLAQSELEPIVSAFGGSFAALWIESYPDFTAAIRVRADSVSWKIPMLASFTADAMRLAALDDTHLIAVWTQLDFDEESGLELTRLYSAVLDTGAPGIVAPVRIDPLTAALTDDPTRRMRRPALAVAGGSAFVAWYANTGFGGDGIPALVLKEMPWRSGDGEAPVLDLSIPEAPLPRSALRASSGAQDVPALGVVPWTPGGALFAAWEDSNRTFGPTQRRPDVVTQLVPIPVLRNGGGN